jgi:hypothetical protein
MNSACFPDLLADKPGEEFELFDVEHHATMFQTSLRSVYPRNFSAPLTRQGRLLAPQRVQTVLSLKLCGSATPGPLRNATTGWLSIISHREHQ